MAYRASQLSVRVAPPGRDPGRGRSVAFRLLVGASLVLVAATAGCGISSWLSPEPRPKPNIAVFIIDTLRADAMGCYGSEVKGTSPELDALAERGVRFANTYAQCSWTRPSVAAMLTGMHPRRLGVYYQPKGILGDGAITLAEILREHGYATFGVTANPHMNSCFNLHQGFDVYIDSDAVYGFMKRDAGQTWYRRSSVATVDELFAKVLEFDDRQGEGPKYVQLNLMEVHEWHWEDKNLTRPEYDELFNDRRYRRYFRAVRQVSEDLGAFVQELRSRPGWDDALLIFVSDHGEGLGDHPDVKNSTRHGRVLYESQLHVPFVMHRKGWKYAGRVVERPVRLMDLMPTVLEAAGLPVPRGLDGLSLMPLVHDPAAPLPLPEYFVAELGYPGKHKAAVYGEGWRYYEHYDGHEGTARRELQVAGGPENGRRTSVLESIRPKADEMRTFYREWARQRPPAPQKPFKKAISDEELEQLRALGYVE
jgi:arylsulfatase A-like enzyme